MKLIQLYLLNTIFLVVVVVVAVGFEATRYPKLQPHSLRYKVHLDNRTGFEKNVVIRLSWKKPEGKVYISECYICIKTLKALLL